MRPAFTLRPTCAEVGRHRRSSDLTPLTRERWIVLLDDSEYPSAQCRSFRSQQERQAHVPGQAVTKAKAAFEPVLLDELNGGRLAEKFEHAFLVDTGDSRQHRPVEVSTKHRGDGQEAAASRGSESRRWRKLSPKLRGTLGRSTRSASQVPS